MAFGAIRKVASGVKKLDVDKAFKKIFRDPQLRAQIIDLNQNQLYEHGIDSEGKSLGDYSAFTIDYKHNLARALGRDTRADHITLKDSGDFYRSFAVSSGTSMMIITANTQKPTHDLARLFGRDILGLTHDSLNEILPEIRDHLIEFSRKAIAR